MEKSVYAYLYICVSCKYIFIFYDFGTKLDIFFVFTIFLLTLRNVSYEVKQSSEKIQKVNMIKLNLRASNVRVSMSSNLLYFNFFILIYCILSFSNISLKNCNIALANYVIKQMKSIYVQPSVLVVSLSYNYSNEITKIVSNLLVTITPVSWVRFVSGDYLLKENVISMFRSYVRVISESYVRLKV